MRGTTIAVYVNREYAESVYCAIDVPVDMLEAFEPLATCDDPIMAIVTGGISPDDVYVSKKQGIRQDAAKRLSEKIAEHLVEAMERNDTHNGETRT